jgi:hypothetical protein
MIKKNICAADRVFKRSEITASSISTTIAAKLIRLFNLARNGGSN